LSADAEPAIEPATPSDAAALLALQKLAYQSEAVLYGDDQIPPLTQTLRELEDEFARSEILKMTHRGQIIGSVRGQLRGGTAHIGRLMVHPGFQQRGWGSRLVAAMEARFPAAVRFELFTGHRSADNLRLYRRLGYADCRVEPVHPGLSMVFLEKTRSCS
jgi:ribosomal protein S18 acetylase RimI-like enzyme